MPWLDPVSDRGISEWDPGVYLIIVETVTSACDREMLESEMFKFWDFLPMEYLR